MSNLGHVLSSLNRLN
jgi:tetratricopeptide (TPR) repeat protein